MPVPRWCSEQTGAGEGDGIEDLPQFGAVFVASKFGDTAEGGGKTTNIKHIVGAVSAVIYIYIYICGRAVQSYDWLVLAKG